MPFTISPFTLNLKIFNVYLSVTDKMASKSQDFIVEEKHLNLICKIIRKNVDNKYWENIENEFMTTEMKNDVGNCTEFESRVRKSISAWMNRTSKKSRNFYTIVNAIKEFQEPAAGLLENFENESEELGRTLEQDIWERLVCTLTNNKLFQEKMISSTCSSVLWKNNERIIDNLLFRVGYVGVECPTTNATLLQNEHVGDAARRLLDNLAFVITDIFINTKDLSEYQWSETMNILGFYQTQIEHLCLTNVQWNVYEKEERHLDFINLKSFICKTDCDKVETLDILNKIILVKGLDSHVRKFWEMNCRIEIWNKSRPVFVLDPHSKLLFLYSFTSCLPKMLEECVDIGYQLERLFYFTQSPTKTINLNQINKLNMSHLFLFLSKADNDELKELVESLQKLPSLQKLALSTTGNPNGWNFNLNQLNFLTNLRFLYLGEANLSCSPLFDWNSKMTKIILAICHPQNGIPVISNCKLTFSETIVSFERIPSSNIFQSRDASKDSFDAIIEEFNS